MLALAAVLVALASPSVPLVAAGDVASCRSTGDEATARLLDRLPGTIALLGDSVYERGTAEEYRRCFSWRRHKARIRPAVGNHEYLTPGARGYFRYFRVPRWYAYDLGEWRIYALDSNCRQAGGCGADSPQGRWLRAQLAAHPRRCALAYAHHPRYSSGLHGSDRTLRELWRIMAEGGVDVFLAGHDHHYERFAPRGGVRQFVVGTGGRSLYPTGPRLAHSRYALNTRYGVLALDLRADGYAWRFVTVGAGTRDVGSASCR